MNNNFFTINNIDFSKLECTDWISPDEFKTMSLEVISDCFEDEQYLPQFRKYAIYKCILKHCFYFDLENFDSEQKFAICLYSNFEKYLNQLIKENNNKLEFIITQLEDCIDYHKEELLHKSALDNIIISIANLLSTLDINEIIKTNQSEDANE